jgi:hypothetical protein
MTESADAFGRRILVNVWPKLLGHAGSPTELQIAGAIARGEGYYGRAVYYDRGSPIRDTNNWGAVQALSRPPCPADAFEATDHHADGTEYQACFRRYATPEEGARDFVRNLATGRRSSVAPLLRSGDVDAVARAMRVGGYFELAADKYADAIERNAAAIARALGEPIYARRMMSRRVHVALAILGAASAAGAGALAMLTSSSRAPLRAR